MVRRGDSLLECVYINLDDAEARRRRMEAAFAAMAPPHLELERFAALGPADVGDVAGPISPAEKACFASHRAVIAGHQGPGDLLVLEDDAVFSTRTFGILEQLVAAGGDWDVLFTEVGVGNIREMFELAQRRDEVADRSAIKLPNLKPLQFFSSTAYVVREGAKAKLLQLLSPARLINPYDLHLRALCHGGAIEARMCFPFITSVADDAHLSQIRDDRALVDATLNLFRRLMYLDRDIEACEAEARALEAQVGDRGAAALGAVFGLMAASAFPREW